ncbi:MAG: hypothetical protein IJ189_13365 [Clostridia bacterium]|nr:hypothetical protein [Clostridia bacterium]
MKRLILCCLLLCLLLSAAWAEDYAGYTIDQGKLSQVYPINTHEAVVTTVARDGDDDPRARILWLKDGQIFRSLAYYPGGAVGSLSTARFLPLPDGSFKVAVAYHQSGRAESALYRFTLYDWVENGLQNPVPLPFEAYNFYFTGNYCLVPGDRTVGHLRLTVADLAGQTLFSGDLPDTEGCWGLYPYAIDDQVFVIESSAPDVDGLTTMRYVCVDHGAVRWQQTLPNYHHLYPDGQGGFIACRYLFDREPYNTNYLDHYDGNGRLLGSISLAGAKLVTHVQAVACAEEGGYILYGTAVARSRKVYTAFALTVDEQMRETGRDVRALSAAYGDYEPHLLQTPDGSVWLSTAQPVDMARLFPALIPFSKLPAYPEAIVLTLQ